MNDTQLNLKIDQKHLLNSKMKIKLILILVFSFSNCEPLPFDTEFGKVEFGTLFKNDVFNYKGIEVNTFLKININAILAPLC